MINIAIFASGNGTNAQRLIDHFYDHLSINIALILSNKPDAYVLKRAQNALIPSVVFSGNDLKEFSPVKKEFEKHQIDFIVLAGFLLMIPPGLVQEYKGRMINIHPALLPKYGGKGMYGMRVHQAVIDAQEAETGITIHYVNEFYDEGAVIFQARCPVNENDTPESLAEKVHALEYKHFPKIVEDVISRYFTRD